MNKTAGLFWGRFLGVRYTGRDLKVVQNIPQGLYRLGGAILWHKNLIRPMSVPGPSNVHVEKAASDALSRLQWHPDLTPPTESYFKSFQGRTDVFLGSIGGEVVHINCISYEKPTPRLFGGQTAKPLRGRGIALSVIAFIHNDLRKQGYAVLSSASDLGNHSSARMHLKLGFQVQDISYSPILFRRDWGPALRKRLRHKC